VSRSEVAIAAAPCSTCPYRRDVPSGIWAASEYQKLPRYDQETFMQPQAAFFCHKQTGDLCAGWVGCHDMSDNLGLRLAVAGDRISADTFDAALDYVSPVELFSSGQAACEHGLADIENPSEQAIAAMRGYLRRKSGRARKRRSET
jgi:hypothetical protein